jgi:uncharacterized OsmC-like protein
MGGGGENPVGHCPHAIFIIALSAMSSFSVNMMGDKQLRYALSGVANVAG